MSFAKFLYICIYNTHMCAFKGENKVLSILIIIIEA